MNPVLESLVAELRARLGERLREVTEFRGETTLLLAREALVEAVTFLRDHPVCPFPYCEDLFGIDRFERRERFEVKYHFFSLREKVRIHLKVRVEESDPVVPTISAVFPCANWYEREAYDMVGIRFDGHPDLRRIYMPEEFVYFPLRKDFPLMGIPGSLPLPSDS